jgi:hypothetical protein
VLTLRAALVCDSATVREGLLHVLGGGVTRVWRPNLPAPLNVALALLLELSPDDLERPHEVRVVISDPAGGTVHEPVASFQTTAGDLEPGERQLVPVVVPLHGLGIGSYGRYTFTIVLDGIEGSLEPLTVVVKQAPGS